MAVRIRLSRHGKKKAPFYRLVVADSRSPRDGRFIEILGTYNPLTNPAEIKVNLERAAYWLNNGASPSDTARILLVKAGVIEAPVKAGDVRAEAPAEPVAAAEAVAEAETAAEATAEVATEEAPAAAGE